MSNRQKHLRSLRDQAVADLLRIHEESGAITSQQWEAAADASTYSVRHLKRCIAAHLGGFSGDEPYAVTEREMNAIYLAGGRLAQAHRHLKAAGVDVPSVRHFSRVATASMGSVALAFARGGEQKARHVRVTVPFDHETRGQTYELDHTELPIYVVGAAKKHAQRPWMTVAIDRETRYVMSWVITFGRPSAEEVSACIAQACMERIAPDGQTQVGGIPERVVWDRGLEFLSISVTAMCQRLEIMPCPLPAYTPEGKARLERFWRFLKEDCLSKLPGYSDSQKDLRGNPTTMKRALGESEFLRIIEGWMNSFVSSHIVSTIDVTPLQAWKKDLTPLRLVAPESIWQDFLVAKDKKKVSKNGIRFDTIDFIAPELTDYVGQHVEIRHLVHDRTFIEVFSNGNHICTAYPRHTLTPDIRQAVVEHRNQSMSQARKWGTSSNRARYHGHAESYPIERSKDGTLTVKQAAEDVDLMSDLEDAFPDDAFASASSPAPHPDQGRLC